MRKKEEANLHFENYIAVLLHSNYYGFFVTRNFLNMNINSLI